MGLLGSGSVHMVNKYGKAKASSQNTNSSEQRCQNCLQMGHWSYECKNPKAYVSRPSRTQQVENEQLQKLNFLRSSEIPDELKEEELKSHRFLSRDPRSKIRVPNKNSKARQKKNKQKEISQSSGSSTSSGSSSSNSSSSSSSTSSSSDSGDDEDNDNKKIDINNIQKVDSKIKEQVKLDGKQAEALNRQEQQSSPLLKELATANKSNEEEKIYAKIQKKMQQYEGRMKKGRVSKEGLKRVNKEGSNSSSSDDSSSSSDSSSSDSSNGEKAEGEISDDSSSSDSDSSSSDSSKGGNQQKNHKNKLNQDLQVDEKAPQANGELQQIVAPINQVKLKSQIANNKGVIKNTSTSSSNSSSDDSSSSSDDESDSSEDEEQYEEIEAQIRALRKQNNIDNQNLQLEQRRIEDKKRREIQRQQRLQEDIERRQRHRSDGNQHRHEDSRRDKADNHHRSSHRHRSAQNKSSYGRMEVQKANQNIVDLKDQHTRQHKDNTANKDSIKELERERERSREYYRQQKRQREMQQKQDTYVGSLQATKTGIEMVKQINNVRVQVQGRKGNSNLEPQKVTQSTDQEEGIVVELSDRSQSKVPDLLNSDLNNQNLINTSEGEYQESDKEELVNKKQKLLNGASKLLTDDDPQLSHSSLNSDRLQLQQSLNEDNKTTTLNNNKNCTSQRNSSYIDTTKPSQFKLRSKVVGTQQNFDDIINNDLDDDYRNSKN